MNVLLNRTFLNTKDNKVYMIKKIEVDEDAGLIKNVVFTNNCEFSITEFILDFVPTDSSLVSPHMWDYLKVHSNAMEELPKDFTKDVNVHAVMSPKA